MPALPAHHTKHIPVLHYPFQNISFHLTQRDDGKSNGTALWLGAQCLSVYLASLYRTSLHLETRPKVVELGSGIGLSALALSSLGWDVLATDIPTVISTVLSHNITTNLASLPLNSGLIQIRQLDWTIPPDQWIWHDDKTIASESSSPSNPSKLLNPPFDLIISADTIYTPALVQPLLRSLHALCTLSIAASPPTAHPPPVYLCIERRDPILVDHALTEARETWKFNTVRIPDRKVTKAMEKGGIKWQKSEWEGVEIWKLTLGRQQEKNGTPSRYREDNRGDDPVSRNDTAAVNHKIVFTTSTETN